MTQPAADLASREAQVRASLPQQMFIDGQWVPSGSGEITQIEDPATGEVIGAAPNATVEDATAALDAAVAAQEAWAATAPRERAEILRRAYELIIERTEDIAWVMSMEMGKPIRESRGEIAYGAEFFRWFSEEAVRIHGEYMKAPTGTNRILTVRQPVGPCLFITPWNFPLAMGTRKIGPALAAGCTVVIKPAPQTPFTMLILADILREAGLPAGVLNVITTDAVSAPGVCAPLLADPRLRKLSFTGSTRTGQILAKQAADNLLRVSLELGGNAPFLVFADADLDAAVEGALVAKMRNQGQACVAANRFLVHADVAQEFAEKLNARMAALAMGRGVEESTEVGPLIDEAQRTKVADMVAEAVAGGAKVLSGAQASGPGYFYAPTVLVDVPEAARMNSEEIFGPVAPITTFTDEAAAIQIANDTPFGLIAYLYTRDITRALNVAEKLEAGMIGLNSGLISNAAAPFGGVKMSGYGREGGFEGINEYLETKYIGIGM